MNIAAIYGSPRKSGNTDILLDKAVEGALSASKNISITKIFPRGLNIAPCNGSNSCSKAGVCVIRNDDAEEVFDKILKADALVLSSPIFFYGLPGHLKCLIDRSQAHWARKYILKNQEPSRKPGAFICAGGTKGQNLFEGAKLTARYFFDVFNIRMERELLVRQVDKAGDILQNKEILEQAFSLGKDIASLINNL